MKSLLLTVGALFCLGLALAGPSATPSASPAKAFLGVHIVSVPKEVRAQTSLEEDAGLMIDFIQPASPAEKAGFKLYDILTNLADQKLLSAEQFTNLIKGSKIGQAVSIGILRQGKPITLEATLCEAPPQEMPLPALTANGRDLLTDSADARQSLSLLMNRMAKSPGKTGVTQSSNANMRMSDDAGSVEISRKDGAQTARVTDAKGNIIFDGPINTSAERDSLPEKARTRIEKLEESALAVGHPGK
jgi:serine protease Do